MEQHHNIFELHHNLNEIYYFKLNSSMQNTYKYNNKIMTNLFDHVPITSINRVA